MNLNSLLSILSVWIMVSSYPADTRISDSDRKDIGIWKEARNSDGVQTFCRWIRSDEGLTYRERKGEMDIQCSLPEAVKIISDARYTEKWMSGINESKNLAPISNNEWYTYTLFSIPWPFSKRDLVSLNKMTPDPAHGTTLIEVTCKEKYAPLTPNVTRFADYRAQWKITRLGENKIHLNFVAASSTPPAFPRYIQDPVIERMFHNNLVRLKELLQK